MRLHSAAPHLPATVKEGKKDLEVPWGKFPRHIGEKSKLQNNTGSLVPFVLKILTC